MSGISKIGLKIGEKEFELSYEEAKELKAILDELFKVEVKEVVKERFVPSPYPVYPSYPHWPYRLWEPTWVGTNKTFWDYGTGTAGSTYITSTSAVDSENKITFYGDNV